MQRTRIATKTEVITVALQELVRKTKLAELKDYRGQIDLDIDIDAIRKRNVRTG